MDTTVAPPGKHENRIIAAISYVPLLFLLPLLFRPQSDFAQFHGKQGLVLFMVWFLLWIIGLVPLISILAWVGYLILIVVAVIAFVKTLMGERWEVPVVAAYAKRLKL